MNIYLCADERYIKYIYSPKTKGINMKRILLVILMLSVLNSLYADQAAWITKEQADKGALLVRKSAEIRHFCAPCSDNFYRVETVAAVTSAKAGGSAPSDPYYEVLVNGSGIDLAYVYVQSGGRWMNAAMLLGIPVEGVPEILPSDLQNEEVEPSDGSDIYEENLYPEDIPVEEGR